MEDKPQFVHDCDRCKFLGNNVMVISYVDETKNELVPCDIYICPDADGKISRMSSFIARHGDDGPAYSSSNVATLADCRAGWDLTRLFDQYVRTVGFELKRQED